VLCWPVMKCPHCTVAIHEAFSTGQIVACGDALKDNVVVVPGVVWHWEYQRCPECHGSIVYFKKFQPSTQSLERFMAYPRSTSRLVAPEVTDPYRQDFVEACAVLPFSAKASAALSRRCLQAILKDKAQTTKRDLFDQIEEVINSGITPTHISADLHVVRSIGNIGAHTMKSTNSGEVLDVEPGEAEWNLDVLESLFDFYFIQPAISAKRKAEHNKKRKEAGKAELP
jgi:hypothetical protein